MNKVLFFFTFCLVVVFFVRESKADLSESHKTAEAYAREQLQSSGQVAQSADLSGTVPGVTSSPPQFEESQLQDQALTKSYSDDVGQFVRKSFDDRPQFLGLQESPLVTHSEKLCQDPLKYMANQGKQGVDGISREYEKTPPDIKYCHESKQPTEHFCKKTLLEPIVSVTPARYSNWWCTSGMHHPDDPRCQAKKYYSPAREVTPEIVNIKEMGWHSECGPLEDSSQKKRCVLVAKRCLVGPQTRQIGGKPITRECWQEEYKYACSYPAKNDCGPLKAQGCNQVGSKCAEWLEQDKKVCIVWRQKYSCPKVQATAACLVKGKDPFCLYGDCTQQDYDPNNEMFSAIAQLQVFKETSKQVTGELSEIFMGKDERCKKQSTGFKNCCAKGKGWGISMNLAGCSNDEKLLAQRREKGLCHEVGTYCSKKQLGGVCKDKKTTFCCYSSKLIRVIHEQARVQLGKGWGNPQCGGLTVEELSRVDFSKLDLSEIFSDIKGRFKGPDAGKMQSRATDRMRQMQQSFRPTEETP